ncbi:threonine ammonia-lyase [Yoonia sp. 208BN28-4]|uniref:threonine ammonia-lyase n=1 Tax=Yoonia sp. 208BN28-4 TaxID=3126505 RepID=UPI0030989D77
MNIDMIRAAAKRIEGHAVRTPMLTSPFIDDIAGRRVLIKPECLQKTGSFKFRGAWSAVSALDQAALDKGVFAFSSGNHAQGVAMAATAHGAKSVILMPSDAPAVKLANTKALGADVITYDREKDDRDAIGEEIAHERGMTLIRPFDEPLVIAGQGTVGLEIAQQAAAMGVTKATVTVCCGGGGLTSGIALALAADAPDMQVRPVEPEGFDDVARSLRAGAIQRNNRTDGSICDAIITPQPGKVTFPILQSHCGDGIVVTEDDCLRTMAIAFERLRIVIEPGGAVGLAAAMLYPDLFEGDAVIAVVSGGNVDAPLFSRALATLQ